jgi:TetR/AcrR family transcriptional regulator, transcriptional repressor for nem operon
MIVPFRPFRDVYGTAMGRPRGFEVEDVVRAAVRLFADRGFDGVSVDDLVARLGVHRNSLYETFGSKRGLYLAALRWHVTHQVDPLVVRVSAAGDVSQALVAGLAGVGDGQGDGAGIDLLLMAAIERAPVDPEVAFEVDRALAGFDAALARVLSARERLPGRPGPGEPGWAGPAQPLAQALTAALLGLRVRARAGLPRAATADAGQTLAARLD